MSDATQVRAESAGADESLGLAATARRLEQKVQRGRFSEAVRDRVIAILSPLVILLIWEGFSRSALLDARFFPPPSSIAGTLVELVTTGRLFTDVQATLYRVLVGLAIGCTIGVAVGLALGLIRIVRVAALPILSVTMPIPKIALLPLLYLILGLGNASKIAVVALGVFFIMVYNTMAGVVSIPQIYLEVGKSFGASRLNFYRTVALPGALPLMLTGFKLSFAVGLLIVVPAEWSGVKQGVGYMIYQSWQTFALPEMYVGIISLGVLGFLGGMLLEELERKLVPWRV